MAGADAQVGATRQPVEEVVRDALEALGKGRPSLVTGARNAMGARLPRVLSRRQTIRLTRRIMTA